MIWSWAFFNFKFNFFFNLRVNSTVVVVVVAVVAEVVDIIVLKLFKFLRWNIEITFLSYSFQVAIYNLQQLSKQHVATRHYLNNVDWFLLSSILCLRAISPIKRGILVYLYSRKRCINIIEFTDPVVYQLDPGDLFS